VDELANSGKLGLVGMRERAQLIGARLSVKSAPGKGTTVVVEIPNLLI
jgi:two-component system sensor histidine kinase DegS